MANWTFTGPKENYEADQAERIAVFKKIVPKGNWKGEIDCWIDAKDYDDCNEAAIWFTGGDLLIEEEKLGKVRVTGAGYYANVGA